MKYAGVLITIALTLVILVLVGIYSFLPRPAPASTTQAVPVEVNLATNDETLAAPVEPSSGTETAQREAVYQEQLTQLGQSLQERQTTYQKQIERLTGQVGTAQAQLNDLTAQEQTLAGQIAELEAARTERLALYEPQLAQARSQYEARYAALQAQLDEVLANLNQANAQLGR